MIGEVNECKRAEILIEFTFWPNCRLAQPQTMSKLDHEPNTPAHMKRLKHNTVGIWNTGMSGFQMVIFVLFSKGLDFEWDI